ncbi:MAG: hypothetical protein EBS87_06685 [Sphingomonadaceae bacterium]|jgi:hypothetical protein|nr:hypothetical protein [Sphingomonadaceae bacterium]NBU78974.1 hypothetical protein [Sphingomonadaceae bacterium]NCA01864.1 hypothetical protein [Sphingomonadaceae bacterium]
MDKSYGRVKHITPNGAEMSKNNPERAARLAEALRANLRKRKAPKADTPLDVPRLPPEQR